MQFAAGLLRINILRGILLRGRRRTNLEGARVGKHVGDFVGQGEAQKLYADVAIHVLQRQHRNGVLGPRDDSGPMLVPPHAPGDQHRQQQRDDAQQDISLRPVRSLKCAGLDFVRQGGPHASAGGQPRLCLPLQRLKVALHRQGGLITVATVLLHGSAQDAFDIRGKGWVQLQR